MKSEIFNQNKCGFFFSLLVALCFFSNNSQAQNLIESAKTLNEKIKTVDQNVTQNAQENIANKTVILNNGELKKLDKSKLPKSIMFTDEEITKVQEAMDAFLNNTSLENPESSGVEVVDENISEIQIKKQSQVYLNAILYVSKNNWIAWVNGNKITVKDNIVSNPIYIRSIDKNKASIVWTIGITKWKALIGEREDLNSSAYKVNPNNQVEVRFTLKTNQTYNLINNTVVEGKMDKIKKSKLNSKSEKSGDADSKVNSDAESSPDSSLDSEFNSAPESSTTPEIPNNSELPTVSPVQ